MKKNIFFTFLLSLLAFSSFANAENAPKTTAYLVSDKVIRIFNSETDKITGNINFPSSPLMGFALSNNGKFAYTVLVSSNPSLDQTVAIIDTKTNKQIGVVKNLPVKESTSRHGVVIAPNNQFAYVMDSDDTFGEEINVINTISHISIGKIKNIPHTEDSGFSSIAITPDSKQALLTFWHWQQPDSILFVDTSTHSVIGSPLPLSNSDTAIAITPDSKKAYLIGYQNDIKQDSISIMNIATKHIEKTINLGALYNEINIAISPDGKTVYTVLSVHNSGNVIINTIDTTTDTINSSIKVSLSTIDSYPTQFAISPDGKKGYITDGSETGEIIIMDLVTNKVLSRINDERFMNIYNMVF